MKSRRVPGEGNLTQFLREHVIVSVSLWGEQLVLDSDLKRPEIRHWLEILLSQGKGVCFQAQHMILTQSRGREWVNVHERSGCTE